MRVEPVMGSGIVLVHALLHQAHAEHARVEVEVFLRRTRDGCDVMKTVDAPHAVIMRRNPAHDLPGMATRSDEADRSVGAGCRGCAGSVSKVGRTTTTGERA